MTEHECIIGIYYDYEATDLVTLSDLKDHIEGALTMENYLKTINWPSTKTVYTLSDYCDKRKSTNLERFEFCPHCGKKIDWKKIKNEDKEV